MSLLKTTNKYMQLPKMFQAIKYAQDSLINLFLLNDYSDVLWWWWWWCLTWRYLKPHLLDYLSERLMWLVCPTRDMNIHPPRPGWIISRQKGKISVGWPAQSCYFLVLYWMLSLYNLPPHIHSLFSTMNETCWFMKYFFLSGYAY